MSGWIGVDLDGTLAEYHGWVNTLHIGPPVPLMVRRVKEWLERGIEVRIFTARIDGGSAASKMGVDPDENVEAITEMIQQWCVEHIGVALPVTCKKDYGMVELWDDRAVQVIPNTGRRADRADSINFVYALATATKVFEQFGKDHPRWWRKIDGTPIPNDIAVRMAEAFMQLYAD